MFEFFKEKKLNYAGIRSFLDEDEFELYGLLKDELSKRKIASDARNKSRDDKNRSKNKSSNEGIRLALFYPGSEYDVANPIMILNSLIDFKKKNQVIMTYVDLKDMYHFIPANIKICVTNVNPKIRNRHNYKYTKFKIENTLIEIKYYHEDAFEFIRRIRVKKREKFDIYFERAFNVIRATEDDEFPKNVFETTSDLIFSDEPLTHEKEYEKQGFERISLSKNISRLGLYEDFSVYSKKRD
ncbi:MAG: hypothetical protein Q8O89_02370 [Nanoarchaeota archaeon]|nr:hypothetical protein [Nanoarchaeota archaeon]